MNIEKEIEKKARELNKFRRKVFILQFIGKSRKSVSQECSEFGISKSIYSSRWLSGGKKDTI